MGLEKVTDVCLSFLRTFCISQCFKIERSGREKADSKVLSLPECLSKPRASAGENFREACRALCAQQCVSHGSLV